jgi:hypothetical protein
LLAVPKTDKELLLGKGFAAFIPHSSLKNMTPMEYANATTGF